MGKNVAERSLRNVPVGRRSGRFPGKRGTNPRWTVMGGGGELGRRPSFVTMGDSMWFGLRSFYLCSLVPAVLLAAGNTVQGPPPAAGKMLGLFGRLQAAQQQRASGGQPQHVAFQLTESEINDYMTYSLRATPRPGLNSVTVKIFPYNYISTYTMVDFDAVERWKPGTVPALLRPVLNGKKAIWVDYRFRTDDGRATFTVEKAYFQSIRLPAFFVEKMIQIVAARQPEHYDTTKPVPLPFGLRRVWTADHVVAGEN